MKLGELIQQVKSFLPLFTDKFTTNIAISTIGKIGDTVSVNANDHGLQIDAVVLISGVKTKIQINSITANGGVATAVCASGHDLTVGYIKYVEIVSPEPAYNGIFKLIDASPDNLTFTFQVSGTPGPSTGYLLTFHNLGFNGTRTVTNVVDENNFEYEIPNSDLLLGDGDNMLIMKDPRIAGAVDLDKAISVYTKYAMGEFFGFFIMNPSETSSDRTIDNDSKNERQPTEDFKLRMINSVTFLAFIPAKDDLTGRKAIDDALDLLRPIYKVLAGYVPENIFVSEQQTMLMPSGHQIEAYNNAFLVYGYNFEVTSFILSSGIAGDVNSFMANTGDTFPNLNTISLKKFNWKIENPLQEIVKNDNFDV